MLPFAGEQKIHSEAAAQTPLLQLLHSHHMHGRDRTGQVKLLGFQINDITQDTVRERVSERGRGAAVLQIWMMDGPQRNINAADLNHFKCKCLSHRVMQMWIEWKRLKLFPLLNVNMFC